MAQTQYIYIYIYILHLDSTPVGTKTPDPKPPTTTNGIVKAQIEILQKDYMTEDPESGPSSSDSTLSKHDSSYGRKIAHQKSNDAIKREIIINVLNRTHQDHRRATMFCPTKVIINSREAIKIMDTGKGILSKDAQN